MEIPEAQGFATALRQYSTQGGALVNDGRKAGRKGGGWRYSQGRLRGKTPDQVTAEAERMWASASPEVKNKYAAMGGAGKMAPSEQAAYNQRQGIASPVSDTARKTNYHVVNGQIRPGPEPMAAGITPPPVDKPRATVNPNARPVGGGAAAPAQASNPPAAAPPAPAATAAAAPTAKPVTGDPAAGTNMAAGITRAPEAPPMSTAPVIAPMARVTAPVPRTEDPNSPAKMASDLEYGMLADQRKAEGYKQTPESMMPQKQMPDGRFGAEIKGRTRALEPGTYLGGRRSEKSVKIGKWGDQDLWSDNEIDGAKVEQLPETVVEAKPQFGRNLKFDGKDWVEQEPEAPPTTYEEYQAATKYLATPGGDFQGDLKADAIRLKFDHEQRARRTKADTLEARSRNIYAGKPAY